MKFDLFRLPAELQPQPGVARRSTVVLDKCASHSEIENESVLAIELTEDRTSETKALKDSTIVSKHGVESEGKHIAAF